jgi:radical SAM protein with 4Fe4S-binding SPASM domain
MVNIPEGYKYIGCFVTMRCNLSCGFCLNHLTRERRNMFIEMSGKEWVEALNGLNSRTDVPITLSGGEPMMHKDFIYIINHLKPSLNIDILTNFYNARLVNRFIVEVDPRRVSRDAPYPSIRVSYHPEQMDWQVLIGNVKKAKAAGFSIGIFSVLYPSQEQLEAIVQMQYLCRKEGIDFRVKDFTGDFRGELYGNYSKYPEALSGNLQECECRTSELLIGPDGNVYKCHRDLYAEEFPIGNVTNPNLKLESAYRECANYGSCHPCDVKVKTNNKQELGHTSVEIKLKSRT